MTVLHNIQLFVALDGLIDSSRFLCWQLRSASATWGCNGLGSSAEASRQGKLRARTRQVGWRQDEFRYGMEELCARIRPRHKKNLCDCIKIIVIILRCWGPCSGFYCEGGQGKRLRACRTAVRACVPLVGWELGLPHRA